MDWWDGALGGGILKIEGELVDYTGAAGNND
jgi:hypothetical protein